MVPRRDHDPLAALESTDPAEINFAIARMGQRLVVPHPGQKELNDDTARFQIVRAGRRFGKTVIAARKIIRSALENKKSMNFWVANTFKNSQRGFVECVSQIPPALLKKPPPPQTSQHLVLEFKNGSRIEFYSGGNADAMAGAGVDFVVIDEAALINDGERVWMQTIRPMLGTTGGRAMIISTPRGRDWFWRLWMKANNPANKDYSAFHFTSYQSPYFPDSEIEEIRGSLADMFFRQEMLAEFVANAASIFNLEREGLIRPDLAEPVGDIALGIDLGKKEDFTVISGSRMGDRLPCYYDRLTSIRWADQMDIIKECVEELESYPGVRSVSLAVDSTGVGDPIVENLEDAGLDVEGINFSGGWKEKAVRLLAADLERGEAFIHDSMTEEFESYEYTINDNTGRYRFEAATGHDDNVSAKLLEHWLTVHGGPGDITLIDAKPPPPKVEQLRATEIKVPSVQQLANDPRLWTRR